MKKMFLLIIIILMTAPFLAGHYVESIFRQRIESLSPTLKLQNYQQGYFTSTAEVVSAQGEHFSVQFTHAPLTLTGLDIARGQVNNLQFVLNWQRELTVTGQVNIHHLEAEINSHGAIESYPQTSVTTFKTNHYQQNQINVSPLTGTLKAQGGTVTAFIPEVHLEKTGDFIIRAENIEKKNINAGGDELSVAKVYWQIPNLDLETVWKEVTFSQRIKTAANGETLSYFLHLAGKQEKMMMGGAVQLFLAPLRGILPDDISADLAIHGLDKSERDLFFRKDFQRDELLSLIEKNLVSQEMSADFRAHLLRRGKGITINMDLKENVNFENANFLSHFNMAEIYRFLVGSTVEIDVAHFLVNNFLFKNFISLQPEQFMRGLGFFPDQNGWHLRAKVSHQGILQFN